MTKEETIKNLEALLLKANIVDVYGDMEDMTPYEDAVNMAIQALEGNNRIISQISDLLEGDISDFDLDDAMDVLYKIKRRLELKEGY